VLGDRHDNTDEVRETCAQGGRVRAVPTKGLAATQRFALGAVLVYHRTLWHRHEHGLALRVGLDPFLKAA
jgi:hypothetical protein